jgi:hypothetical protein
LLDRHDQMTIVILSKQERTNMITQCRIRGLGLAGTSAP